MNNRPNGLFWILLALFMTGPLLAGPGSPVPAAAESLKVQVADPQTAVRLEREWGARIIADYGAYLLLEVDRAAWTAGAGAPGVEPHAEYDFIALNTGWVHTRGPAAAPPGGQLAVFSGKRLHLLQFIGPIQPEWYAAAESTGARIVTYIPHNAYLLYLDSPALGRLKTLASGRNFIQWEGDYLPEYRIQPGAFAEDRAKSGEGAPDAYTVQLVQDPSGNTGTLTLIQEFQLADPLQDYEILQYRNITVPLPEDRLMDLALQPDVVSIQPWYTPQMHDERQGQIMANHLSGNVPSGPGYMAWLLGLGFTQQQFTSSGFVVDVTDSGIDDFSTTPNHFALYVGGVRPGTSRVAYNRIEGTVGSNTGRGCDGHGNLNAHIVAGYNDLGTVPHVDAAGYHYGLGICPWVKVGSTVIFDPGYTNPNYNWVQSEAYKAGARISTNSWGAAAGGAYNSDSQAYDTLVRDARAGTAGNQEMVILFSAGNSGSGSNTIGSPGTGKNIFCVGAAENVHPFGADDQCGYGNAESDSADDVASYSSRGPCDDGRAKPDIQAPGTHVSGGVFQVNNPPAGGQADDCYDASSVCAGPGTGAFKKFWPQDPVGNTYQWTTASTGTSHSCPATAGAAALLRQWFINQGAAPPSPAMTKAYLMNSTRYMTGAFANDTLPSNSQGMGEVNLGQAFDGTPRVLVDQTHRFTATGQTRLVTGNIQDGGRPFRVTLAWTDAPGSTSGNAYNNNLDLTVSAGGQIYYGNVFSEQTSVPGGGFDQKNNVESVFLPAGVTGPYMVTVTAANINSNGVPGNPDALDQDFALVIYNANEVQQPIIVAGNATLTGEQCLPANGVPDPGETVTYTFSLGNQGTAATANLTATLQATGGVTVPSGPTNYGAIVPGATAAREFTFTVDPNLACGAPVVITLALADGATDLGTATFTLTTGVLTAPVQVFAENFDTVAAPALPPGWAIVDTLGSTGEWITATATVHPSGSAPNSAPNLVYFNSYSASAGNNTRLYHLSGMDLSPYPGAEVTLRFWFYHDTGYTSNDRLQAQVSTDGGTNWIDVGTAVPRYDGSTGWAEHTVSLAAYAGLADVRIALHGISAYGNDCHVDDLTVETRSRVCCGGALPGDLNHDGLVNAADLLILADYLGGAGLPAGTTPSECDLVADAVVDATDLAWLQNRVDGNL